MSLYQHLKREKEVADYVSATSLFLYTERVIYRKSRPGGRPCKERGRIGVRCDGTRDCSRPYCSPT